MRDHGGNLDWAITHFGGNPLDWIDLSTGINRAPYPVPPLSPESWTALPTHSAMARLTKAASAAYGSAAPIVALAGAQAAIQMIPRLAAPGLARVLGPTYNEHAACLRAARWQVEDVASPDALAGADLAVLVNPNNPTGQLISRQAVLDLVPQVGRLVVDESFADSTPVASVAPDCGRDGLIVLRSFGKFYGLAGVRLGFALGAESDIAALSAMAGPWPITGAAIEIGTIALADRAWANATIRRLEGEVDRLDAAAVRAGWRVVGGTTLFRLYDTPDAKAVQEHLGGHQIWSRVFPYSARWLRLGLPGGEAEWARTERALAR